MEIIVNHKYIAHDWWTPEIDGVVLVSCEEDIDKLHKLLCEEDSYWENYKHLIKVAPKEIEGDNDLRKMCEHCGKTDIWDYDKIRKEVDFITFQYDDSWFE